MYATNLCFALVFAEQQQHCAHDLLHERLGVLVASDLGEDFLLSREHRATQPFDARLRFEQCLRLLQLRVQT